MTTLHISAMLCMLSAFVEAVAAAAEEIQNSSKESEALAQHGKEVQRQSIEHTSDSRYPQSTRKRNILEL
jgi:hypothetical protein